MDPMNRGLALNVPRMTPSNPHFIQFRRSDPRLHPKALRAVRVLTAWAGSCRSEYVSARLVSGRCARRSRPGGRVTGGGGGGHPPPGGGVEGGGGGTPPLPAVGWFVHFAMMLITFLALAYYGFNIGLHPTGVVALSLTTFVAGVSASDSALLLSG